MGRRRGVEGSANATSTGTPSTVPIASIAYNPRNPRDSYDDIGELAESIQQAGVLQPLGVVRYEVYLARYPEHETEIGSAHWVVIHGNRRLAAATKAGLTEVPVIVQERLGREDVFDETVLIENVHRKDLPPLREAALLQELVSKHGSGRRVAAAVGKTSGWVTQRLSLLKLVPQLQQELASGNLTIVAARELAQIPATRQMEAHQQGEPYRDPGKPEPEAKADVVSGDRSTYTHTELDPQPAPDSAPATASRKQPDTSSNGKVAPAEGAYAVSTPETPERGDAAQQIHEQEQQQLVTVLRRASVYELAGAIRSAYSAEQCLEIASQLQS